MRIIATIIACSFLLLVGCGGAAAPPPPDTSGLAALDAQATLNVWGAQQTAVAKATSEAQQATIDAVNAAATATKTSEWATAQAVAAAGATVAAHGTAVAVEATATAGAGYMAATAQAAAATATRDGLAAEQLRLGIAATATADAAALAFQEAQAEKALAARQAEIDRELMWNRLVPWLAGIVAVGAALAMSLFAGTWAVERLRRTRPQQAGDVWVMVGPGGPVALNRPPAQIPASLPRAPIRVSPAQLPAGDQPIPLPEVRHGHVLIAGETGSGKSTAMRAILAARGERVVVLDPHHSEREGWGAAQVIGAGRDYGAISDYMEAMGEMLRERYEARRDGRDRFEPLTVAVDEMPSIVDAVGRDIAMTWRQWLREGRKVGLFLVLATQSTRVRTLGIEGEGDLLENFTFVLTLGDVARKEYGAVVNGMARPAALVTKGRARPVVIPQVEAVSRSGFSAGDLDGDGDEDVIFLPDGPLFTAPTPRTPKADPRNMRPEDMARIRTLKAEGWSQRAIEEEMFGYTGGAAWVVVREALDGEGRSWPASAAWPAPGQLLR